MATRRTEEEVRRFARVLDGTAPLEPNLADSGAGAVPRQRHRVLVARMGDADKRAKELIGRIEDGGAPGGGHLDGLVALAGDHEGQVRAPAPGGGADRGHRWRCGPGGGLSV